MDRKDFLKTSGILSVAAVAGLAAFIEACKKAGTSTTPQGPSVNFTLDLTQSSNVALNTSGGSVSSNGVIVVNKAGSYVAVAQSCTHQGCSIGYDPGGNDFVCPCHGGTFDMSGNVTSGPPPAPLKTYTVTKTGNILTVSG